MPEPSFHHVGYAVRSVDESLPKWREALRPIALRGPFNDPLQHARVVFLEFAPGGGSVLELIEPLGEDSPLARFVTSGGGLHHLCFEVDDIEEHIRTMRAQRAALLSRPRPAVAFNGRRIAWMSTRENLLVEYLERELPRPAGGA